jgi:16S rRNA G966 N2-methylase RsmD
MSNANPSVESHYETLEAHWNSVDGSLEFERLVVPTGNSDSPFHRWFHLKEAFSVDLFPTILKQLSFEGMSELRVLDCFAGGGTTLVSALEMSSQVHVTATGIERNPFLHHVSSSKVRALQAGPSLARELEKAYVEVQRLYASDIRFATHTPGLSTFSNEAYFPPSLLDSLLRIKAAIEHCDTSTLTRDILLTSAASCVESSSRLRRDGRALRYAPERQPKDPWLEFSNRIQQMIEDTSRSEATTSSASVILGDGRRPLAHVDESEERDLIIFSPPYPNNIDYTEIYKMEAWYLGFYQDSEQFRSQRLRTLRSHPSVRFSEEYDYESSSDAKAVHELLAPILGAVPDDRYATGRRQLIRGYADDMLTLFRHCRKVISNEGRLVYVVGNSAHGSGDALFVIAADLMMARLAELANWRVEEISVARILRRRVTNSRFLRESVVTLSPA